MVTKRSTSPDNWWWRVPWWKRLAVALPIVFVCHVIGLLIAAWLA